MSDDDDTMKISTTELARAFGDACIKLGTRRALHLANEPDAQRWVDQLWEELDTRLHTVARDVASAEPTHTGTALHAAVEEYRARVQAEMDAARAATEAKVARPVRYELVNAAGQPVSRDELSLGAVYTTSQQVSLADDGTVVVRLRLEDVL